VAVAEGAGEFVVVLTCMECGWRTQAVQPVEKSRAVAEASGRLASDHTDLSDE
jgi:hypothetical protein